VSSKKYDKPLRIELRPSTSYLHLIRYSHALSGLYILYLISLEWWTVLLLLPLLYSYKKSKKNYQCNSRYLVLRLYSDGRFFGYIDNGAHHPGVQIEQVIFLYQLLILTLRLGKKKELLLLFSDAMSESHWHQLQLFVRFALQPMAEA